MRMSTKIEKLDSEHSRHLNDLVDQVFPKSRTKLGVIKASTLSLNENISSSHNVTSSIFQTITPSQNTLLSSQFTEN